MSKPFFEVFPTLKAGEDIRNMFEGAQVLKVTTNSDRTFLRVHIVSRHLIQKTLVYEMEHLIKNQLFGRSAVQVEIREKYELSGQYTPENVMAEYLDSFLAELDTRSVVERNMLQNAKCTFEEGNILLHAVNRHCYCAREKRFSDRLFKRCVCRPFRIAH